MNIRPDDLDDLIDSKDKAIHLLMTFFEKKKIDQAIAISAMIELISISLSTQTDYKGYCKIIDMVKESHSYLWNEKNQEMVNELKRQFRKEKEN